MRAELTLQFMVYSANSMRFHVHYLQDNQDVLGPKSHFGCRNKKELWNQVKITEVDRDFDIMSDIYFCAYDAGGSLRTSTNINVGGNNWQGQLFYSENNAVVELGLLGCYIQTFPNQWLGSVVMVDCTAGSVTGSINWSPPDKELFTGNRDEQLGTAWTKG